MKTLPKCSIDVHAYIAHARRLEKQAREAKEAKKQTDLTGLLKDIANVFKVDMDLLKAGDQQLLVVTVRRIFYYIGRTKIDATYVSMAKMVGKNSHRGCIYHIRMVQGWLKMNDAEFVAIWNHYLENSKLYTKKDFQ